MGTRRFGIVSERAALRGNELVQISEMGIMLTSDPSTGEVLGKFLDMDVREAEERIERAYKAFQRFSQTTPQLRADILDRFHGLMQEKKDDLARIITLENGKCLRDSLAEVSYAASYLQWNAGEALRMYGRTIPSSLPGTRNYTVLEPVGVVAALCPWNFPMGMICRKVGPALAVGATVVIKCPAETPRSVLSLLELARAAGVPDDVIQVITTDTHLVDIGRELCTNKKVKKISFTGSTAVGKILMNQASSSLKKLSFELGGNAPFIVFGDADVERAVAGAIACKFRGAGQTCVCANRLYVHEDVYAEFSAKLAAAVDELVMGPGLQPNVTIGPLIHTKAVAKCFQHVEDAVSKGAKVLTKPRGDHGPCFFAPTVLGDVPRDCVIMDEETFGPVAALVKFSSEDEVIALANDTDMGLAGYFFTADAAKVERVSKALQVGMVGVNTGVISQAVIPFGGIKESGFGKEGGSEAILDFCTIKTVIIAG
ncbi:aldehyde dehydrogenase domain-containing protein [Papiliotrema laurentii]|uniref:succinate-semialdehyde dehydrogenase [NAD(P)(+)] n=1 Tax=Papiliotrema laurentii TaxID=5418 RepID=A0AAD9FKD1_PAPLA|nr:aldehyde dehydrogenase domain-containing protein [Papiliotrema laurentii]